MSGLQIAEIAGQGMNLERSRLEHATLRLSLASMEFNSTAEALDFIAQLRQGSQINGAEAAPDIKKVKDATSPLQDLDGYIYKFDIDPTHEMATLISATRAYEANIRAYNANSQMNKAAMEIGAR
jgi:flagellar basal-body rod protein FlgC